MESVIKYSKIYGRLTLVGIAVNIVTELLISSLARRNWKWVVRFAGLFQYFSLVTLVPFLYVQYAYALAIATPIIFLTTILRQILDIPNAKWGLPKFGIIATFLQVPTNCICALISLEIYCFKNQISALPCVMARGMLPNEVE